jgi:hypothetical protein
MTDDDNRDDDLPPDEDDDVDLDEERGGVEERWSDFTSVFVLRARQPFEDWARAVLGKGPDWSLPTIDRCHAFLTPELPTEAAAQGWLRHNYAELFEQQLEPWTEDEAQWPPERSLDTFLAWFEVVFAPTVDDMTDAHVPREVTCAPLSLRQVRSEFLGLPAESSLHVDVETGELFAWTDDELEAIHAGDAESYGVDADDMRELQDAFASESLIEIAHRADIDNVDTMVAFVATVELPAIRNRLLGALEGKKAHRRFREAIDVAGLRHRWSAWFERRVTDTLRQFMDERGVPFVDDAGKDEGEPPGA